jgi:hypothetical protein
MNCPICIEIIEERTNMAVCLKCGETLHNSCWVEFIESTKERINSGDYNDPSDQARIELQCPNCRGNEKYIKKIGDTNVPAGDPRVPAQVPVNNHRDRRNRYEDTERRRCKTCQHILQAGHYGNYCNECHRNYRRLGTSRYIPPPRRSSEERELRDDETNIRKCGKCRQSGHDRRRCPM